jgi:hypothetical protein
MQTQDAVNSYQADVIDVTYLGENLSMTLKVANAIELIAVVKATAHNQALLAAKTVAISFSPADVRLLAS